MYFRENERAMTTCMLLTRSALSLLLLCSIGSLCAQDRQAQPHQFAIQVEGLTSDDRDALQRECDAHHDLRIVFACVPAGIIVIEDRNTTSIQETKQRAMPLMNARMSGKRVEIVDHDLAWAEQACAEMRNR